MIFNVHAPGMPYLSLVVRADSEERAREIAERRVREYTDDARVELERVDPTGPEGVIVEDPS